MNRQPAIELPKYSHTQEAPLSILLYGTALACMVLAWIVKETPGLYIAGGAGLFVALLAPAFHHLAVEDRGDSLLISFGPLPLFRRSIPYADIENVEVGRTLLLDGWSIHMSIRGGWVWNLWGRDCVVLHLKKGVLRIGTDDAEGLAEFLRRRIGQPDGPHPARRSDAERGANADSAIRPGVP